MRRMVTWVPAVSLLTLCCVGTARAAAQPLPGQTPGGMFKATMWGETVETKFVFAEEGGNKYLLVMPGEKSIGVSSDLADLLWDAMESQRNGVRAVEASETAVTISPLRLHGYRTVAGPEGWHQFYDPVKKGRSISKGLKYDVLTLRRAIVFEKGRFEIPHADEKKGCHVFTFVDGARILPADTPNGLAVQGITYELRPQKCAPFGSQP
jgi:hypothetical protein